MPRYKVTLGGFIELSADSAKEAERQAEDILQRIIEIPHDLKTTDVGPIRINTVKAEETTPTWDPSG